MTDPPTNSTPVGVLTWGNLQALILTMFYLRSQLERKVSFVVKDTDALYEEVLAKGSIGYALRKLDEERFEVQLIYQEVDDTDNQEGSGDPGAPAELSIIRAVGDGEDAHSPDISQPSLG